MNPFVFAGTFLYFGASIWYATHGQYPQCGMFAAYGVANVCMLMIK